MGAWFTVRVFVAVLVLVGAGVGAGAQETKTTLVMPPAPLLPRHFGPWEMKGEAAGAAPDAVSGPDAEALKEDGLERSSQASYARGQGGDTVQVTVLEFGDATGAAGAFTLYRKPEMRGLAAGQKLGNAAAVGDGEVLFWVGRTVAEATAAKGRAAEVSELDELAAAMPKVGGPKGAAPLLPTLVPVKNLQAGSVRYALGPVSYQTMGGVLPPGILGWEKSAEAVTATYDTHGGKEILTLLLYPTPQIAGDRGRAIEAALNAMPPVQRETLGTIKLRREGPMLVLATGALTATAAESLVGGVHLPMQLSWDKPVPPEFHTEIMKTYSLLTSIAVLSGVLMLAAVILGLMLGGGRALVRVLQGKPAASEPEFLHLDLRGQSAPLRSESQGQPPSK